MSEVLIASLQKRIEELTTELAGVKAASKDRQQKGKVLAADLEHAKAQVTALATERDNYKARAESGPAELNAKIAELEGKLTSRDHRDAFAKVEEFPGPDGKKYRFREGVDVDALWQLSGYKAEGATPDAQAIAARLGEAAKAHPFLFSEVTAPAPKGATMPYEGLGRMVGPGIGKPGSSTLNSASGGQRSPRDGMVPGRI